MEAGQSAIRFDHADFDPDLAEYQFDRHPRTGSELHVAQFFGADAYAGVVVSKAAAGYVVEERPIEVQVERMFDGVELDWGESGRVPSHMGYVRYRMFRVAGQSLSCLGFGHTFGEAADGRGRKNNLVVGWFCYDETRPPSAATATDLIGRVSLSR